MRARLYYEPGEMYRLGRRLLLIIENRGHRLISTCLEECVYMRPDGKISLGSLKVGLRHKLL